MRNTIVNNKWNTTDWGLAFLRVSSFPLDPSCTFESSAEFQSYLNGEYKDKPYLGQIISVKEEDKYKVYIVQGFDGAVWSVEYLVDINKIKLLILDLRDQILDHVDPDLDSLKKILDKIKEIDTKFTYATRNLQEEINKTQTSIGLDQSGNYTPDQSTHYLKNEVSIMSALRTLDDLIYQAMANVIITPDNKDVVDLSTKKIDGEYKISANLKLSESPNNGIVKLSDGLSMKVDLKYNNGILLLLVNDKVIAVHNISLQGDFYTKSEILNLLSHKADLIDGKVPEELINIYWHEIK